MLDIKKDEEDLIKKIGALSQKDFYLFCCRMLSDMYGEDLKHHATYSNVFFAKVPSGFVSPLYVSQLFLIDYLPYELFINAKDIPFDNPIIRKKLLTIVSEFNKSPVLYQSRCRTSFDNDICGIFFMNHITGQDRDFFWDIAYNDYKKMICDLGLDKKKFGLDTVLGVGSPYSYVGNAPQNVINALDYVSGFNMQLSIEYADGKYEINRISQGKYVTSGVSRLSGELFYPQDVIRKPDKIAEELENLLNSNPSERLISEYITENYRYIFGAKYDMIRAEVDLRFPELDIANKNRRIDIMLHDSIADDWELIELKKNIKLSKIYRGLPVFSSEISGAIQQLKNYSDILQHQRIREYFLREGIEYYHPTLKLIVGGNRNVSHAQWRKMLAASDVRLITYDDLIKEMKMRYSYYG